MICLILVNGNVLPIIPLNCIDIVLIMAMILVRLALAINVSDALEGEPRRVILIRSVIRNLAVEGSNALIMR